MISRFLLFLGMVLGLGLGAQAKVLPDSEAEAIKKAYARVSLGAKYKAVDTMLSVRTKNYALLSKNGSRFEVEQDRLKYTELFRVASRVRLTFQINKLESQSVKDESGPTMEGAVCQVKQVFEMESVDPMSKKIVTRTLRSITEDTWVKRPMGWRILSTRVLEQAVVWGLPFVPDRDLPVW